MSSTNNTPIGPGTRVSLGFTLKLPNGEVIDSTGDKPATFEVGDGNLPPGFERALYGLRARAQESLTIPAAEAFGVSNPDNVQMMKKTDFASDIQLEEGLVVSFADPGKAELPGVVTRVLGDLVEVDFNHPLAGRDLVFEVLVHSVEQISNEIARS